MREAKTKAQRDPAVQAEWDRAIEARTDYEKREALKSYYKMLYGRIAKIDPTLKKPIEALETTPSPARADPHRADGAARPGGRAPSAPSAA